MLPVAIGYFNFEYDADLVIFSDRGILHAKVFDIPGCSKLQPCCHIVLKVAS